MSCCRQPTAARSARLAVDVCIYRLSGHIGAMLDSLDGLEAVVFTAGVGENSPASRVATCGRLRFLGLTLDEKRNAESFAGAVERDIAQSESRAGVMVIPAQKDWAIARQCLLLVGPIRG